MKVITIFTLLTLALTSCTKKKAYIFDRTNYQRNITNGSVEVTVDHPLPETETTEAKARTLDKKWTYVTRPYYVPSIQSTVVDSFITTHYTN